jgi:Anti-sigma-K factor rskA, C-terminal
MGRPNDATVVRLSGPGDALDASTPRPVGLSPVELPRARRPGWPTLAALALATGIAAIGAGAWSILDDAGSRPTPTADPAAERSLAVLADSTAERHPLRGSVGRIALVATDAGDAVLALDGLGPAPAGSTYRVWLVPAGSATPVGDVPFDATSRVVPLDHRIPPGTRVAVTLEPSADTVRPSRPLRLSVVRG